MKKWLGFPPLGPKSYALYAFMIYCLFSMLLRRLGWPNLFPNWGVDGFEYSRDMIKGAVALLLLFTVLILLTRSGIRTLTPMEKLASLGMTLCFLLIPSTAFFTLSVASDGFTVNPSASAERALHLQNLDDLFWTIDIILIFIFVIALVILRYREGQVLRPTSPGQV